MAYNATTVANRFLSLAQRDGKYLTNMQLQKLVYIAHGFYLAFSGKPLLSDEVKAWQWGPVIVELYEILKRYGAGSIPNLIPATNETSDPMAEIVIQNVWRAYGHFSRFQLSTITHRNNSPWSQTWESWGGHYETIPNEVIARHYQQLLNERRKANQPSR